MKNMNFLKSSNMGNKTQIKNELILSIQKNYCCLDLLNELTKKSNDTYKFTETQEDKETYEKLEWIRFQIAYLTDQYEKSLKKLGGNPNGIQSIIWK